MSFVDQFWDLICFAALQVFFTPPVCDLRVLIALWVVSPSREEKTSNNQDQLLLQKCVFLLSVYVYKNIYAVCLWVCSCVCLQMIASKCPWANKAILLHFLQVMRLFDAHILPWNAQELVIGSTRAKHIENSAFGETINTYQGAILSNFLNVVNQYAPFNLKSVGIVAGQNYEYCSCPHFTEGCRSLLDFINYKIQPLFVVSPKIIATSL